MWRFFRKFFLRYRPGVFRYWDGYNRRHADAMTLYVALLEREDYLPEEDLKQIDSGDIETRKRVIAIVSEVFDAKLFDGKQGLLEDEALNLLDSFYDYIEAVKKNIRFWPTSAPSMASGTGPMSLND